MKVIALKWYVLFAVSINLCEMYHILLVTRKKKYNVTSVPPAMSLHVDQLAVFRLKLQILKHYHSRCVEHKISVCAFLFHFY